MDEQLPPDVTASLNRHLDDCEPCRQFRQDLELSRRLMAATEPRLPENFDWRLQLRLNQVLQQAAAETAFPWHDPRADRRAWLRNFGSAAAVGMAAVLAMAVILGPAGSPPVNSPAVAPSYIAGDSSDRLPLNLNSERPRLLNGTGVLRSVSSGGGAVGLDSRFQLDRIWSGGNLEDQWRIQNLRLQNRQLTNQVQQYRRQLELLRAQLDSTDANTLDLGER